MDVASDPLKVAPLTEDLILRKKVHFLGPHLEVPTMRQGTAVMADEYKIPALSILMRISGKGSESAASALVILQAKNCFTAFSFQATPDPDTPKISVIPSLILTGSAIIGFHQSAYSSQWAVGVTQSNCALISGHR